MDASRMLATVRTALDTLCETGGRNGGLFPSILDRETGETLREVPPAITGRREWDRAHHGANLLYDEPTLQTLYALSESEDREEYAATADRYLERFATHCTDTETGLFPWGEHAFWHLPEDRLGNSLDHGDRWDGPAQHDHFRLTPRWLWERLVAFDPDCLRRFADGLEYHWNDADHTGYNRHAYIGTTDERYGSGSGGDFPSAGGYYVNDWAHAYARWGERRHRDQLTDMLAYWWQRRSERDLLPISTGSDRHCPGMTLTLAVCLFEAAAVLEAATAAPDLVDTLRTRANAYTDAVLRVPYDPDDGVFFFYCTDEHVASGAFTPIPEPERGDDQTLAYPAWGSVYGGTARTIAECGLDHCAAYRHSGDDRLLENARGAGAAYLDVPFPESGVVTGRTRSYPTEMGTHPALLEEGVTEVPIVAGDPGNALGLFAELYALTGERRWLEAGRDLAADVVPIYFDAALPRGAATVDHYESQMQVGRLIHGLARLALLDRDGSDCGLAAATLPSLS